MRRNHALRKVSSSRCSFGETAKVLKRRRQIFGKRGILSVTIFLGGNFQMQSSAENLHYVFDIGDHPTVVTCLPIAAESFKLKSGLIVQMDGRKAKFSQFIFQNCSPAMLLTKCL